MSNSCLRLVPARRNTPDSNRWLLERRRRLSLHGASRLSDEELLALSLGHTQKGKSALTTARMLLEETGGLKGLSRLGVHGLRQKYDLSFAVAARLRSIFALAERITRDGGSDWTNFRLTRSSVETWARPHLARLEHEEVWVLCTNARACLISAWMVGRGGMHGCGLLSRDILTPVVREGAAGFVLVHNHPSGDPSPSPEDIEMTRLLGSAAATLGVPLLDHVVVARDGARSFFELGILDRM